jgi:amidase
MATLDTVLDLDATAQAELVRRKEIKPIELVDAAIARIEHLNPAINAVVTPMYDLARDTANNKLQEGPFTGVPFLLKDMFASYAGVRMTMGSTFLRDNIAEHDNELVIRQKRAGLIILGKTNTSEFGLMPTAEPLLFGPTRNPWDISRTSGGSSGGSAAAVAAGMVAMAHGADGGGSIRIPASCCGLFGLKPTRARNPFGPDYGDLLSGLVNDHALTRSVRDSAALLDATSGPDIGDPYWAPPPERPFSQEVGADPGRLRVAFTTESPTGIPVHRDCVEAVKETAKLCADLGHEVEETTPDVPAEMVVQSFIIAWAAGAAMTVDGLAFMTGRTATPDQFETLTWALCEHGRKSSASEYLIAVAMLQRVARIIGRFLTEYDVWLSPTLAEPPGRFDSPTSNPLQGLDRAAEFIPFTPIANFTGQPAMSVPLYWNEEGLPIGSHFLGRFGGEATLFRLAAQLEEARPWADRRPDISV